jgi:hypothetical protein
MDEADEAAERTGPRGGTTRAPDGASARLTTHGPGVNYLELPVIHVYQGE